MSLPVEHDPTGQVSENFQVWEMYRSETAARHDIDNRPAPDEYRSTVYVARTVLQPVRDRFGRPYSPNSVFRCQELERALKNKPPEWISKSQHTKGEAADFEISGIPNRTIAEWVSENVAFDQLILELFDPAVPGSGWVHVSTFVVEETRSPRELRGEVLSYVKRNGSYLYVPGLAGI